MSLVEVSHVGPVATLTLDRPEARNALSVELCDAISDALEDLAGTEARAIVVAGRGKTFCSGADFAAVSGPGGLEFLPRFERMLEALARVPQPTIARIQGAALGGGFQLATVCDFRIASEEAKLGIPAARLGIVVNIENVRRLVQLAGVALAKRVLITGETFDGVTAAELGLVGDAVPEVSLEAAVADLAGRIAALSPLSVRGAKRSIQVVLDETGSLDGSEHLGEVAQLVTEAYGSSDLQEGIRAMAERRPPQFEGR